jgi:pyroglutamyl-peptidase
MSKTVLLTSFSTWQAYQQSNSSDDLLLELLKSYPSPFLHGFRQLPVNLPVARELAIAQFTKLQPQILLCCGMAESRTHLTVESSAVSGNSSLHTTVELGKLIAGLTCTEISHDAGQFVCNSLYYAMLNYLQAHHPDRHCLFVHVPVLTAENRESILADFRLIVERVLTD